MRTLARTYKPSRYAGAAGPATSVRSLLRPREALVSQPSLSHVTTLPAVQRHSADPVLPGAPTRPEDVHRAAQDGLTGHAGSLPHLTQIQQSFGPAYDLTGIRAYVGGEAGAAAGRIGAEAYATGPRLGFRSPPNLRLAAHEAAHVVQQRTGVQLANGVGRSGDLYERNADRVAERVVRGEPAWDILPTPGGPAPVSQPSLQLFSTFSAMPYDLLSDDGKMAVKDHTQSAWAESSNIARSNSVLDTLKSKVKIEELAGGDISVAPPAGGATTTLKKFRILDRAAGGEVELTDDCGHACQEVLGADAAGYESFVGVTKRGTTEEFTKPSKYEADDNAAGGLVSTTERMSGEIFVRIFEREFKKTLTREDALKEWDALGTTKQDLLSQKYGINKHAVPKVGQGITIGSERDMPGASMTGYNFHFGFNLMASGHDYITLEDYASSGTKYYFDMYGPESKGQSWAEAPSNTGALDARSTTMVVQHPESLNGIVNADNVHIEADPATPTGTKTLSKDTKVTIIRKGQNWMKVEVKSGARTGESGWILNKFYTDD